MHMNKIFLSCLLLISQIARASVSEQIEYEYYTVNAAPNRTLLSDINEASPIHEYGHTFHGHTHWNVSWHFWWHETPGGACRITEVKTEATAKIQLPRLVNANTQQQAQFDKYIAALRVHELGHADNGKQAANEIDRGIMALPEMPSCTTLSTTANALGRRILREHNDQDLQYDAATGHGKTQGAVLQN
jgi:predicted secreted Zn-dependent protease